MPNANMNTNGKTKMNNVIKLSDKRIDLARFRFRRQPLFDYSLFDPASESEWIDLERTIGLDDIRQAFFGQGNGICIYEVGRTSKDEPVLCAFYRKREGGAAWFAGVCWAPADPEMFLAHVPNRIASIGGPAVSEESGPDCTIVFYDAKQKEGD